MGIHIALNEGYGSSFKVEVAKVSSEFEPDDSHRHNSTEKPGQAAGLNLGLCYWSF